MEKKNFKNVLTYALFYGSLWGLTEATLGYVLHTLPALISGSVMFPIALFFMIKAYKKTGTSTVFLLMGSTAALIKFVDIFIPGLPVIKTINPMIAIMLEATAVAAFSSLLKRNDLISILTASLGASFLWRILFVTSSFIINSSNLTKIGWVNSSEKVVSFIIFNGALSALIAFVIILLEKRLEFSIKSKWIMRPAYGVVLFISASFIQFII